MKRLGLCLAGLLVAVWGATNLAGASPPARKAAEAQVQRALEYEVRGSPGDREALLRSTLEKLPDYAPARWHSGYVREGNRWVKFDEVPVLSAADQRLAQYRRMRSEALESVDGQMQLARWCLKQGLADQARAHLTKVLALDANHAEARQLLGHRLVDGVWLSPEELESSVKQARKQAAALARWQPKLLAIRQGLQQTSYLRRQAAEERLRDIDDPAAIPVMEQVLFGAGDSAGLLMVESLDHMPAVEASLALTRLAVYSPSFQVRDAAAKKLQSRDMDSYVPAMLAAMRTPIQTRSELYVTPAGRLVYRHVMYREGPETAERAVLDTEYRGRIAYSNAWGGTVVRNADAEVIGQDAAARAAAVDAGVARQNAATYDFNQRVCEVLATATGQDLPPEPEQWWKWWNEHNEVYLAGDKPVDERYARQENAEALALYVPPARPRLPVPDAPEAPVDPAEPSPGWTIPMPPPPPPSRYECLVAGTLVWTATGPMAIETIRPGDRVLAQDPETGELALKPVLRTTLRPPAKLVRIQVDEELVFCSGGHPFWVAGKGWVKARDLTPGMTLHGLTGAAQLVIVDKYGSEPTYNLVVADFHTYFVGKYKLLSHDNTIRRPTNSAVPGLVKR